MKAHSVHRNTAMEGRERLNIQTNKVRHRKKTSTHGIKHVFGLLQYSLNQTPDRFHSARSTITRTVVNTQGSRRHVGVWLTLLRAATLWASSASTSGSVSALRMVCWSFCSASSSRSCSCLFLSSVWLREKKHISLIKLTNNQTHFHIFISKVKRQDHTQDLARYRKYS